MERPNTNRWTTAALGGAAVAITILLGWQLRMVDPMSSPVIAAEDPYTHMALVREHLYDGTFEPLNPDGRLYPPGLHALLAAWWVYTGSDLYDIVRFGGVAMGALAMAGFAILLWRFEGPVAAFVGTLAFAVAPEAILRTSMMAPTALDLAVMPFFFFALLRLCQGRLAWAFGAAPIALLLLFAHPWVLTIIALAGAGFALLAIAMPWPVHRSRPVHGLGLGLAILIVGLAWALSIFGCWGACNPGFSDKVPQGDSVRVYAPLVAAASLALAALFAFGSRILAKIVETTSRPVPLTVRVIACLGFAAALAIVSIPALRNGMPDQVHLVHMFGVPILTLAALAVVLLPFMPSPAAHLGFALAATTYPFVIYNPLQSEFWPHRTAVYLGLGLVLLAGVFAAATARATARAAHAYARRQRAAGAGMRARPAYAGIAVLFVALLMGGTVLAQTPDKIDNWYRLYTPCEHDALKRLSHVLEREPGAIVISGTWQSKLVLAAMTTNASRVWYMNEFFHSSAKRDEIAGFASPELPVYVVADRYLVNETPPSNPNALQDSAPWDTLGRYCHDATGQATLAIYAIYGEEP